MKSEKQANKLWSEADKKWRSPLEVMSLKGDLSVVKPKLLEFKARGNWWKILNELNIRLLVSREYEHLLICLGTRRGSPEISYLSLPHPSGIAVNEAKKTVYIASTRNPNMIYRFAPVTGLIERKDKNKFKQAFNAKQNPLIPQKAFFLPGSLYIHDIVFLKGKLYANAVGHNSVIEITADGKYKYIWWPKCVNKSNKPDSRANYLQLNSIAAGKTIFDSYFSASSDKVLSTRPGDVTFPVDKRGVVFSGKTKEVICRGLTRPHSVRIYKGKAWLDNSGYGEVGFIQNNKFKAIAKLPGWTRGLYIKDNVAFVGTSRVIPRFSCYAPGVDLKKSICGVCAVDINSGKVLGSLEWPSGNQIFAIEGIKHNLTSGFPLSFLPKKSSKDLNHLFYSFI